MVSATIGMMYRGLIRRICAPTSLIPPSIQTITPIRMALTTTFRTVFMIFG